MLFMARPPFEISIHVLREEDDGPMVPQHRRVLHFYPRPPRGGRQLATILLRHIRIISIHVLREEDDPLSGLDDLVILEFLSTSSARRTTCLHPIPRKP